MQSAASTLISEDAAASRGQLPIDDIIEEERALDADTKDGEPVSRYSQDDKSFPPPEQHYSDQGDERRPTSGLLTLQGPLEGFELSTRRSTLDLNFKATDTKFEKREKRKAFWRRQFINFLLICSWYLFSSLISLYSECA